MTNYILNNYHRQHQFNIQNFGCDVLLTSLPRSHMQFQKENMEIHQGLIGFCDLKNVRYIYI